VDVEPRRSARAPGKRAQTREQNRREILAAARRVFAELGYGATTVRDIIRATPLASGTFYNYFKSKEEVFQALRNEAALAIRPQLREARTKADTLESFLSATFRTFFTHVSGRAGNLAAVRRSDSPHVRVDTPEIVAGFEELQQDIEAAIARGIPPAVDPLYLTAAMVGVAFEIADAMQKREGPPDVDGAVAFATALFRGGCALLPRAVPNGQAEAQRLD
jgi:AcrR family transcriptional regulator